MKLFPMPAGIFNIQLKKKKKAEGEGGILKGVVTHVRFDSVMISNSSS